MLIDWTLIRMVRRPVFFYGWVIVGISIAIMILAYGIRHSFSVFFPPILAEFGWSRGNTAIMLSLNLLIYGLVAPVAGSLGDRWKPREVMLMGVTILGLSTAGCTFASELWHFYLLFGILAPIGTALCGWPLIAPALTNWFVKRRGLVLGLGQMGSGLSFSYSLFAEFAISRLGWRSAYFAIAGVMATLLLPLILLFFHYRPESKNLKAYGTAELPAAKDLPGEATAVRNPITRNWTLKQILRTHQLWLLVLTQFFFWGIGFYLVLAHQVKFAEDVGYSSTFAASIFALFGIFMAAGQLSGLISDWVGREITVTLAAILSIGALVALISVNDTSQSWLLYVYAVCFGCGGGLCGPTMFAGAADMFYGKHFGVVVGLLLTGMGVGGAIGPWLGGYLHDISGSYIGAFVLCMVCIGLACVAFWIAAPRKAARL